MLMRAVNQLTAERDMLVSSGKQADLEILGERRVAAQEIDGLKKQLYPHPGIGTNN